MMIHPIYLALAAFVLVAVLILLKRASTPPSEDHFVDLKDTQPPPHSQKKERLPELVTMYLIPKAGITGNDLLQFLLSHNLQYSAQCIFQQPSTQGNRFYVAALSSPGTFDLKTMAQETFPGLSFFLQPRLSSSPLEDFDSLCNVIFDAKDRFNAKLQSTQKEDISLDTLRELREAIANEDH